MWGSRTALNIQQGLFFSNYVYYSAAFMISCEYWAEARIDVFIKTPKTLFWVNLANLDSS